MTVPQPLSPRVRASNGLVEVAWRRFLRHRLALPGAAILGLIAGVCLLAPLIVSESLANQVGFYGRWIDSLIMRLTDAMLSMPSLLVLIVLTRILGPSVPTIVLVIGLLNWMQVTRLVRANFLSLKEQDFVLSARAIGVPDSAIIFRHILPNTLAPVVVAATLGVGHAIILEASASFLGLGVQPPTASWGSMLNRAQGLLIVAPWVAIFPGLLILLTVMAINFLGDGLRDALDPRAVGGERAN